MRTTGELKRKPNDNQDVTVYRKIDIENLRCIILYLKHLLLKNTITSFVIHLIHRYLASGNVVEFTMWDKMAENFEDAELETLEQPVIIAVTSCRVTKFRGILILTITAFTTDSYYVLKHYHCRLPVDFHFCNTVLLKPPNTRS